MKYLGRYSECFNLIRTEFFYLIYSKEGIIEISKCTSKNKNINFGGVLYSILHTGMEVEMEIPEWDDRVTIALANDEIFELSESEIRGILMEII